MEDETAKVRKGLQKMSSKTLFSLLVFILSLLLVIGLFVFKDSFRQLESLGLFGIFLVNFISASSLFIPTPAFLTVIAGGSVYPPIVVAIVSSLGATLGDMIFFLLGYSGRKLASGKKRSFVKKVFLTVIEEYFRKYGSIIIFLLALIPNPLFDGIGLIAGVFSYSPRKFFIIVLLGRIIRYWFLAVLGNNL